MFNEIPEGGYPETIAMKYVLKSRTSQLNLTIIHPRKLSTMSFNSSARIKISNQFRAERSAREAYQTPGSRSRLVEGEHTIEVGHCDVI